MFTSIVILSATCIVLAIALLFTAKTNRHQQAMLDIHERRINDLSDNMNGVVR